MTGPESIEKAPAGSAAKALGAFYTDSQIADFLVWWAVRGKNDTVMDPSFGGGAFLRSACKRMVKLGGDVARQVFGVELAAEVHRRISDKLRDEFGVPRKNLLRSDFFDVDASPMEHVAAVVGNPPFIRYQRFSGAARQRALARAAELGVKLSELSSSWAPFLVHCVAMLTPGGRLAMVIPMELGYATYARPILSFLTRSFQSVTFLTFKKKLFPDISEDTLLLLCESKGRPFKGFYIRDFENAGVLDGLQMGRKRTLDLTEPMNAISLSVAHERLVEYLLPRKVRELYRELRDGGQARRLGEFADVGIGYVTGANDFFHLGPDQVSKWRIPPSFLRPAVRKGRAFTGVLFTKKDWRTALQSGDAAYLLSIADNATPSKHVKAYLNYGARRGVPKAYKCRNRSPWYRVRNVYEADGFMSYMSGDRARLVVNLSRAVAPNSLHVVRLRPQAGLSMESIAALWHTSLPALSAEIEGHALGGGMLKLEPKEAENVMVGGCGEEAKLRSLSVELDEMVRSGREAEARDRADTLILRRMFGLSKLACSLLRKGAEELRNRRISRTRVA